MSVRLWLVNALLRYVVKPHLARTKEPEPAAEEFERVARLVFRRPPFLLHLKDGSGPVPLNWITGGPVTPGRVILYLHGGAYFVGSGDSYAPMLGRLARLSRCRVCAPDYRLLQDQPFPAPVEDARAAWDMLRAQGYHPQDIVLGGDSAGGGLALALLSELLRDGQIPAGLFAFSPWTDLAMTGDSLKTLGPRDAVIPVGRMSEAIDRYLCGADPRDPRASPLFADFPGPPPVLIQVGSAEALLDDSYRMADRLRAAGGEVLVQTFDDTPHVWHLGDGWLPESRAALQDAAAFVQESFAKVIR